jgi:hypothetical protein
LYRKIINASGASSLAMASVENPNFRVYKVAGTPLEVAGMEAKLTPEPLCVARVADERMLQVLSWA